MYYFPRGVLRLVNDGDDRRTFFGLEFDFFSIPGFFGGVGKFGKYFLGLLDLDRGFFEVLNAFARP